MDLNSKAQNIEVQDSHPCKERKDGAPFLVAASKETGNQSTATRQGYGSQSHRAAGFPFFNHTMKSVIGGTPPNSRRRVAFCPR